MLEWKNDGIAVWKIVGIAVWGGVFALSMASRAVWRWLAQQ